MAFAKLEHHRSKCELRQKRALYNRGPRFFNEENIFDKYKILHEYINEKYKTILNFRNRNLFVSKNIT